jgi:hypothetical protein
MSYLEDWPLHLNKVQLLEVKLETKAWISQFLSKSLGIWFQIWINLLTQLKFFRV